MIGLEDRPRCGRIHKDSDGVRWQCALYPFGGTHGGFCAFPDGYTPPKGTSARRCVLPCCDRNGRPIPVSPRPSPRRVTQSETAGDRGIAAAVEASGPSWLDTATGFMHDYCRRHREVFCDDIWEAGLPRPDEARAFGHVMRRALSKGWIERTEQSRKSVSSNNSTRPVYRSLIAG